MIDLTLNDKDRDNFITTLYLKEKANKYIVKYASGRLEEQDFSIHNFNQTLYLMEEQFLEYKDAYIKNNLQVQIKYQVKRLIEALVTILGVVLTINISMPEIIQGIILGILALYTFLYQVRIGNVVNYGRAALNVVSLAEKFLEMKDKFKIKIIDPKTGEEENWYLVTLASIEQLGSVKNLESVSEYLTDERKNKEREKTELILNKRMAL